jgi:RND family efflux transporter MFP subunit
MWKNIRKSIISIRLLIPTAILLVLSSAALAQNAGKNQGPPPVPVKVAEVKIETVSDQITLVGTAEAIAKSIVASEVSGVVEQFPVREGDFVKKGGLLARLKSTNLQLLLNGAKAGREKVRASLQYAEKELERAKKLKDTNSIAGKNYDEALYNQLALYQGVLESEAEIERLKYEIEQKRVAAPFSGFVAEEHTQVGQWINPGGAVVTLLDLGQIRITVDVPERYAVMISPDSGVKVVIKSISENFMSGKIYAVLPQGNPDSRTFPVRINLPNPDFKIKSGMEAAVTFNLSSTKSAVVVPKDAIVTAGNNRLVFLVAGGKAIPLNVKILGYYDGNVAIEGNLQPGGRVVVRGNERLMPGQAVQVIE